MREIKRQSRSKEIPDEVMRGLKNENEEIDLSFLKNQERKVICQDLIDEALNIDIKDVETLDRRINSHLRKLSFKDKKRVLDFINNL